LNRPATILPETLENRHLASGSSSLPIYHQIYTVLRQQIKDGNFGPDGLLPAEKSLCETYGVSRVSVRKALELLESEGLVIRRRGVGTFASSGVETEAGGRTRIAGLVENLITLGLDTTAKLITFDRTAEVPNYVAVALNLAAGTGATSIERLRFYRQRPLSLTTVYLPPDVGALLSEGELDDRPVVRLLESRGIRPFRAEQTISAVSADRRVAEMLNTSVGAPLIRLRRTVYNDAGRPFEYQQGIYNPDEYEYHMLLTRDNSTSRPQWRHIG
jgi:GntR family transcriptional regulator